jgi:hypothetical protein
MASQAKDAIWLEWIAGLMGETSRQTHAATFPPDRFYCLLDELPLHLVPQQFFPQRSQQGLRQPLFLNPHCSVLQNGQLPKEFAGRSGLLDNFAMQGTIAWVNDPATGGLLPFWLGPTLEAIVSNLRPGAHAPNTISEDARFLLETAGILAAQDHESRRRTEWDQVVAKGREAFRERGYVPLARLIHPFHLAALRRYYRYLIRQGDVTLGDSSSPRRYALHNEGATRFFHHQLVRAIADLAGETIKPSYVYVASYLEGAELKKHTDREQCEFSVTLCADFAPEPALLATPWPIRLDTREGQVTVYQALGDGLMYRGTKLPHYRDRLPNGQTSTSIFFHYVAADFKGQLE